MAASCERQTGNVNKVQGWAAVTHAEPFDVRVLERLCKQGAAEPPWQLTHCVAKPRLRGQRSVPPLPSCDIKGRAPAGPRRGAFPAERVQLQPSLVGAGCFHASHRGGAGHRGLGTGVRM